MSDLVVIGFDDEHKAFELRAKLAKLQKEYLIKMEDVVVVTKDDKGKVKLHQATNLTAAGAVGGTFWGMLNSAPCSDGCSAHKFGIGIGVNMSSLMKRVQLGSDLLI